GQPSQVVALLDRAFLSLAGLRVLLLGLAFKPGTDDVRDSASFPIAELLLARGARLTLHDPLAAKNFCRGLGKRAAAATVVKDWRAEAASAELIVVVTKWPEYQALATMELTGKTVLDARRMFEPKMLSSSSYLGVGQGGP